MDQKTIAILGAGPSGLTAAYELTRLGKRPLLIEKSDAIGGLARTYNHAGYHFDLGGHRFFTELDSVQRLWEQLLGEDLVTVNRISRIHFQDNFIKYPIAVGDILRILGIHESLRILASYLNVRLKSRRKIDNLEDWLVIHFGERLYKRFFKDYTEKVWGLPCRQLKSEWAHQRIEGLSIISVLINALSRGNRAKSLISAFYYPKEGPSMMWRSLENKITAAGGELKLHAEIVKLYHSHQSIQSIVYKHNSKQIIEQSIDSCISTIPVNILVSALDPPAPYYVIEAANNLKHRAFIMVGMIIDKKDLFPDQWLYLQDKKIRAGRIQNFKNWSRDLSPDLNHTHLGMEYFCTHNDSFWNLSDQEIIDIAVSELVQLKITPSDSIIDTFVIRQPNAYPLYDDKYDQNLGTIKSYLQSFDNFQTIGRNGLHRYSNMDFAMYSGLVAGRNVETRKQDLWEIDNLIQNAVHDPVDPDSCKTIIQSFAKIDKFALGSAIGAVCGLFFFTITFWAYLLGPRFDQAAFNVQLLGNYFFGYAVSCKGAFIALGYGFFWGFLFGWLFALLRNLCLAYFIYKVLKQIENMSLKTFFDQL